MVNAGFQNTDVGELAVLLVDLFQRQVRLRVDVLLELIVNRALNDGVDQVGQQIVADGSRDLVFVISILKIFKKQGVVIMKMQQVLY